MQGNNNYHFDRFSRFSQCTANFPFFISTTFNDKQLSELQNYQKKLNTEIEDRETAEASERKYSKQQWLQRIRERVGQIWDHEISKQSGEDPVTGGRGSKKRKNKKRKAPKKANTNTANKNQSQQEFQQEMKDINDTVNKVFDQNNVAQNSNNTSAQNAKAIAEDPTVVYNQQNPFDVSNYVTGSQQA